MSAPGPCKACGSLEGYWLEGKNLKCVKCGAINPPATRRACRGDHPPVGGGRSWGPGAAPGSGTLLALLLLSACIHRAPSPDLKADRVEIYWQGHPPIPGVLNAIEAIRLSGRMLCAPEDRQKYDASFCAIVTTYDDGFQCGGRKVHGCNLSGCLVSIGWQPTVSQTTLVDELGHFVWQQCRGLDQTGEDLAGHYSHEFSQWVDETRAAVRAGESR